MNDMCPLTPPAVLPNSGGVDGAASGDVPAVGRGAVDVPSVPPPPVTWAPMFAPSACPPPPPPAFSPDAPVLRLSQLVAEPQAPSSSLPSMGSADHHIGGCKPCAFFHTKGCSN